MDSKSSAMVAIVVLSLFFIGGVLYSIFAQPQGLKLLAPLLIGPGFTILGLGILYDHTIGPLTNFGDKLDESIAKMYRYLGLFFVFLGLVLWQLG